MPVLVLIALYTSVIPRTATNPASSELIDGLEPHDLNIPLCGQLQDQPQDQIQDQSQGCTRGGAGWVGTGRLFELF